MHLTQFGIDVHQISEVAHKRILIFKSIFDFVKLPVTRLAHSSIIVKANLSTTQWYEEYVQLWYSWI